MTWPAPELADGAVVPLRPLELLLLLEPAEVLECVAPLAECDEPLGLADPDEAGAGDELPEVVLTAAWLVAWPGRVAATPAVAPTLTSIAPNVIFRSRARWY